MLVIWISLGFIHLTVSDSYLTDINFWILLGLFASYIITRIKQNRLEEPNRGSVY